jgi:phosphoribosylformylglycinamidine synthase
VDGWDKHGDDGRRNRAMKSAVILFPGSNRERDVARAIGRVTGAPARIVWHGETELPAGTDLVVLPGGFSYGDYLRCGAIAARSPVMASVARHAAGGGLVLGICNGFQILVEAGLLPGALLRNSSLRFVCRLQHLKVERADTAFTRSYRAGEVVEFAIAHGDGNYVCDEETLARLEGEGLVAFRYCDAAGRVDAAAGPNGSRNAIAGIYSPGFNVLGLMPHPENLVDPLVGGTGGVGLFASVAA